MPDLDDGQSTEMKGSGAKPYVIKNVGGVYSCTCPAWRNQSAGVIRTCKHIRKLRGDAAEEARLGAGALPTPVKPKILDEDGNELAGPPVLLAETWDNSADLAGWWMSEKLDGVRAYWDGGQFLSRQGNPFLAPDWFTAGLPRVPLDGELWIGRKAFQRTVSVVRRQDKSDHWKEVRFLVFDAPAAGGPFEDRLRFLAGVAAAWRAEFAAVHEHAVCSGIDHLRAELRRVEALGGEGLMLRQPKSLYEAGRSSTLLKVKSFLDAEAVVIGYEAGAGKHKGRVGALQVRLPNGKEFKVGTGLTDKERENPPKVGAVVTFRYQELSTDGIPRFPSYVGERIDAKLPPPAPAPKPVVAARSAPAAAVEVVPPRPKPKPILIPAPPPPPAAAKPAPTKPAPPAAGGRRHFECTEGGSSKFWEIWADGKDVTTRWGKIGTAGQEKTKTFPSAAHAQKEYDKLLAEKTGKGYVETR